jgi:NAD(P)H-dependent FMN reductase
VTAQSFKILAMSGSSRQGSLTKKFLTFAVKKVRERGCFVTEIDLRSFDLPVYDGDLERYHGLPNGAKRLHNEFKAHQALLLGVTEYNGGVSPLLKNAIDWASRPCDGDPNLAAIRGKLVAMVSCSAGMLGGSRAQAHLRQSFQVMGCILIPETANLANAEDAFLDDEPRDLAVRTFVDAMASRITEIGERLVR